jgi:tetratricopeptide (TPR) repeat protein
MSLGSDPDAKGKTARSLLMKTVPSLMEIRYEEWVEGNHDYLDKISEGKIVCVHIRSMNQPSLARAYEKKGDLDRAIAEYERLISPDPKKTGSLIHPRFYYSLGKLYEAKGRKDKAHIQYRRFLDLWKDADRASPKSKMPKPAWLP